MKRTIYAIIAAFTIFAASTPAVAGYWEAALRIGTANQYLARFWYYGALQLHYASNYGYVNWSLIYSAYVNASTARNNAYYAWWNAPVGSYTEQRALDAYNTLAKCANNLWLVYIYGGRYPAYATNAIVYGTNGQFHLSAAAIAAAGNF
jgi:hypothetical protein